MTVQTYPASPITAPLRGTLLDAATVSTDSGYRMIRDTEELFQSFNCMRFQAETDGWCGPATGPKTLASANWTHGFRFAVQGGVQCSTVGFGLDEAQRQVQRNFETGESAGVERALMRAGFREGPVDPMDPAETLWDAAVDITPAGGAVAPALGVALLEGFMADNYSGAPTLHLPRTVASLLVGVDGAEFAGNVLNTKLGSKIAAGAGYDYPNLGPDGTPVASPTERWMYASGEVYINRGETIIKQAVDMQENNAVVLVERPYMAALDCLTVAIRVSLTA